MKNALPPLSLYSCETFWCGNASWQCSKAERFSFPQYNAAVTDLLICIDNIVSCSVIFNYEEKDVMLEKFWHDILIEQFQDVLDSMYKFTWLIRWERVVFRAKQESVLNIKWSLRVSNRSLIIMFSFTRGKSMDTSLNYELWTMALSH